MSKFKVGDKVRGIQSGNNFSSYNGWISKYAPSYRDKWDDSFPHRSLREGVVGVVVAMGMHELQSYGMLYLVQRDNDKISLIGEIGIELVERARREFIVIRRSGAETIAELRHDREVIKSAKATCAPSDTFDLDTGAKLAFDRLMGREEPKPAPQPAHRFKVGDRVVTSFGAGWVKRVDANSEEMPYCIEYDIGVTLWRKSNEAKPEPAPEPPKFYTGKVFACDSQDTMFRKRDGYIFEFSNGLCVNARPDQSIPTFHIFRDIAEIRKRMSLTTWHEVKSDV